MTLSALILQIHMSVEDGYYDLIDEAELNVEIRRAVEEALEPFQSREGVHSVTVV